MESHGVHAVLVDEEAVGSVDEAGCGAKILYADGELERFLTKKSLKDSVVSSSDAPVHILCPTSSVFLLFVLSFNYICCRKCYDRAREDGWGYYGEKWEQLAEQTPIPITKL